MPTSSSTGPGGPRRDERGRFRTVLAIGVLLVVVGAGYLFWSGAGPLPDPEGCSVTVGDVEVDLDTEQAENATLITAIAVRRGLPARAASIALATAFQESKLRNVSHGDRDSLGLFQQRPSQGWGTIKQVMDPVYATNAFYDALIKIDDYTSLRITEAAQQVQRSGFPEAYEEHAPGARALASALTGYSSAKLACVVHEQDASDASADAVRRALGRAFGGSLAEVEADGDKGLDVSLAPVTASSRRLGWTTAQYLVANARRLHVAEVVFDGRVWRAGRSSEDGWKDYRGAERSADHVHVEVA